MDRQHVIDLERALVDAARRAHRAGDKGKADAYRYAAYLTRQVLRESA